MIEIGTPASLTRNECRYERSEPWFEAAGAGL